VRKIGNGKKKWISVLVLAVMVFAMAATSAYGATGIDTTKTGSITLNQQMACTELSEQNYKVPLYRVATVDVTGKYTLESAFDTTELAGIEEVKSTTSTDEWKAFAQAAKDVVDQVKNTSSPITPTDIAEVSKGTATVSDLPLGLYLADVPTVTTDTYEYIADPLLIAVPGNKYNTLDENKEPITNDTWLYEVKNNLKFTREDRYGDLVISKTIDTFNTSLGTASFVFQVTAVKDYAFVEGEPDYERTVYNDVISIDFLQVGTKTVTIEGIPAGAVVTVEEVYSGANYTVNGNTEAGTTITAKGDPEKTTAKVEFTNTYNNTLTSVGTAVVNHFSYDANQTGEEDPWTWTELIDGVPVDPSVSE
jgi:hypothetical protein